MADLLDAASRTTETRISESLFGSGYAGLGLGTGCSVEQGDQGAIGPSPTEATVILEVPSVTTEFCSFTPLQDTTTVTTDPELMQEILTLSPSGVITTNPEVIEDVSLLVFGEAMTWGQIKTIYSDGGPKEDH
jgi:hypothetical protein